MNSWPLPVQILSVAALGLFWGGLLDRAVDRLEFEKSLFWPFGRHCRRCWRPLPIGWWIPLAGPLFFRRCAGCGAPSPWRRLVVEIVTATLFAALYWHYLGSPGAWVFPYYPLPFLGPMRRALFVYHALLFSFLIVATFIDLELMVIPDSVTIPGMLAGVVVGTFWFVELHPVPVFSPPLSASDLVLLGADWCPNWIPGSETIEAWMEPHRFSINIHWQMNWNRWLGFLTSTVGLLAGGLVVWLVRLICTWAFGREAMGLGDVTLMAMVGSFLGWQSALIAFFLAPVSAIGVGLFSWLVTGRGELPYGPHLSIASAAVVFLWRPIWRQMHLFFADTSLFWAAALVMLTLLFATAVATAWIKRFFGRIRRPRRGPTGGA